MERSPLRATRPLVYARNMNAKSGRMASVSKILVSTTSRMSPGLLFKACAETPSSRAQRAISFRLQKHDSVD